jgi:hypothetical protein
MKIGNYKDTAVQYSYSLISIFKEVCEENVQCLTKDDVWNVVRVWGLVWGRSVYCSFDFR